MNASQDETVIWFENLTRGDVPRVGGKNASLGEMVSNLAGQGVAVPSGFAASADAYWRFIEKNGIRDKLAERFQDERICRIDRRGRVQAGRRESNARLPGGFELGTGVPINPSSPAFAGSCFA